MADHEECTQEKMLRQKLHFCSKYLLGLSPHAHLVEHRELHPWLEVGCDVCELIKAAVLLLLTHAVIKCR